AKIAPLRGYPPVDKSNFQHKLSNLRLNVIRGRAGQMIAFQSSDGVNATSILSSRGQVVIPSEIRNALRMENGDRMVFRVINDQMMVVSIEKLPTSDEVYGILASGVAPEMRNRDWNEILDAAKKEKVETR
ncbi:AbrB/MazE/SpoVT family DNA-binding domain-containing protein, partial [Ferroacidibacillus organovorans]|uniref:AbrB/MazE/SpoVT family DNA-binding domain-containing protein n=1 Tax=Ferroacidibacillus organovorans TaxID=1765683 RepID=UPI001C4E1EFB